MKLIAFGDSWTAGHGVETDEKFTGVAKPHRFIKNLREQNAWPRWVADKLQIPFVNMGVCAYGNEYIIRDLEDCLNSENFIEEDDIVIVVFTHPYRWYESSNLEPINVYNRLEVLLKKYKHFYFNAFVPLLEDATKLDLPKYYIDPTESFSSLLTKEEIKNGTSVWEYGRKTVWKPDSIIKGWRLDYGHFHPNLNGYKIISEYIYNNIIKEI